MSNIYTRNTAFKQLLSGFSLQQINIDTGEPHERFLTLLLKNSFSNEIIIADSSGDKELQLINDEFVKIYTNESWIIHPWTTSSIQ